ncbi:TPA: glycosyltransferase family 2 protein, partial [Vibrio parahaemolyticus]
LKQSYSNIEVIIINDGSDDNSQRIVEEIIKTDTKVKLYNIKNNGVSNARNIGLKHAEGEYVIFVDADDYISSDYVEYMYELAKKSDSDFIISSRYFKDENDLQTSTETFEVWDNEKCTEFLLYPKITVGCWNKMYRLDFLNRNNIRFQTELYFGEGLRFITDVSQRANSVCVGNRKVYYYRLNEESCTAVHNVGKAKASFVALDSIRSNLILNKNSINKALKCHYWINHFMAIRFMKVEKLSSDEKQYRNECIKYIRKNLHHAIFSNAKLKIRLTSLPVALFPNLSAKIFNRMKGQG